MLGSLQRQWLTDILESVPSLVFVALLRSNFNLEAAGWVGAGLSFFIIVIFIWHKVDFNPIFLGINIHLLLVTPIIVSTFQLGASEVGEVLTLYSYKGVLITIFVVGFALTCLSRKGFIDHEGLSKSTTRKYSVILLFASAAGIAWAFLYSDSALFGVGMPIIALFALRRLLIARSFDSNHTIGIAAVGTGTVSSYDIGLEAG